MSSSPDASDFAQRAEHLIRGLVQVLDQSDPDELEAEVSEGVLRLTFADGKKCILNRQSAARQIWLAEGATAWHFEFDDSRGGWFDTRGRGELREILGHVVTQRLGRRVVL